MAMVATSTQQKLGVNSFIQDFQTHYNKGRGKSKNKDCQHLASIGTEVEKTAAVVAGLRWTTHRGESSRTCKASLESPFW